MFRGCDLTRAQLLHTGLRGVRYESSKLMGIDWSSVSPNPEVSFEECNRRRQGRGCALRLLRFGDGHSRDGQQDAKAEPKTGGDHTNLDAHCAYRIRL